MPLRTPVTGSLRSQDRRDSSGVLVAKESVYFPSSESDLAVVVTALAAVGRVPRIEGISHYISPSPHSLSAPIALSALNSVTVEDGRIHAGPAATMRELCASLLAHDLFLPLRDVISSTVTDALADPTPTYFDSTVCSLRTAVSAIRAVDSTGAVLDLPPSAYDAALAPHHGGHIVTRVTFDTMSTSDVADLWLARLNTPFSHSIFEALLSRCLGSTRDASLDSVGATLQTRRHYGGLPMLYVTLTGHGDDTSAKAPLDSVTHDSSGRVWPVRLSRGADVLKSAHETQEMGAGTLGKAVTTRQVEIKASLMDEFLPRLCDLVTEALGTDNQHTATMPGVSILIRAMRNSDGALSVEGQLLVPINPNEKERAFIARFNVLFPAVAGAPVHVSQVGPRAAFFDFLSVLRPADEENIIGFEGEIYPKGSAGYEEKAHQYATTSYPDSENMAPKMVAYPNNAGDVVKAISYAKRNGCSIVARSGGHQYCGLSSGGDTVIVLSMDNFHDITVLEEGSNIVTIGSGTALTDMSTKITALKLSIPHGECPLVNVGGHTQTGGYGHTLRSFGLLVDYVVSFRIVLADGVSPATIVRPNLDTSLGLLPPSHPDNDDIFFGALGGGPGSFGVILDYTFEATRDSDHPNSTGLSAIYAFSHGRILNIMNMVREWTEAIHTESDTLLPDMDMMATAMSLDLGNLRPNDFGEKEDDDDKGELTGAGRRTPSFGLGFLLLELLYGNKEGNAKNDSEAASNTFTEMFEKVTEGDPTLLKMKMFDSTDNPSLSYMCDSWVRNFGMPHEGREYNYPYEKRLNGTFEPLTQGFVERFATLVTTTIGDPSVRTVFQMTLGGGMHRHNPNKKYTACARRNVTIGIVFDIFYTNDRAKDTALKYQETMRQLLEDEVHEGEKVRFIWGSYGCTDMSKVWENYYDNRDLYSRLQDIKKKVDGSDVFHTEFTVQLPPPVLRKLTRGLCTLS